ncbi:MAG TPA: DUF2950 domain-containing protein [Xanthobacteraceae bacterium]|jgi:hypothetical protein|nr:DUF2950 domain-containing protein [Xanthobacteraceae bacterium]
MITNLSLTNPISSLARLLTAAVLAFAMASAANAQQSFKTPEEAVDALVSAAKAHDRKGVLTVLGAGAADIVSSGDEVADRSDRDRVLEAYDAKHQLVMEGADKAVLVLGNQDWPFPIPLVRKDGTWRFDTAAGREEILFRRVGRNELAAIQAILAYVDAQHEYAEKGVGGNGVYAQRIVSRPGTKDGLYWPAQTGEDDSPLGEFAASAAAEGYRAGQQRIPYHGYYYKVLTRQGPNASGGALDYVVRGKMIGGFALVAYPAQYDNSGIMTFLVNHQGTIYEKDLGPQTAAIAGGMTAFNPDSTWQRVSEADQASNAAK